MIRDLKILNNRIERKDDMGGKEWYETSSDKSTYVLKEIETRASMGRYRPGKKMEFFGTTPDSDRPSER